MIFYTMTVVGFPFTIITLIEIFNIKDEIIRQLSHCVLNSYKIEKSILSLLFILIEI